MKILSYKFLTALLVVSLLSACTKNFEEFNTNPNEPEVVPLTNLLISGLTRSIDRINGASMNMTYAGLWAQHYAKIQYIDEDYYQFRESAMEAHWEALYAGPLVDLQDIINTDGAGVNMKAAAMTLKAYVFSVLTDCWGAVPYSQALNVSEFVQPVYDSQEAIYRDLVEQLRIAAAMFDVTADDLGAGDMIYGGDVSKWKKFANSLRVRLLNRMVGVDPSVQSDLMSLVNSSDVFQSNDDNATLYYPGDASWSNPIYENKNVDGRNDHAISKTMTDMLGPNGINDPRLPIYADQNINGEYAGQPNGSDQPADFSVISAIGTFYRDDPTNPVHFMCYDELLFIKAEVNGDKQTYLDAIQAGFDAYGVSGDQAYWDAAGAAYDADAQKSVITYKWIGLFGNGCEAWSEYRRTGYPSEIQEVPGSVYPGLGIPNRFAYPGIEVSTNEANLANARADQNINSGAPLHGDKMWWAN